MTEQQRSALRHPFRWLLNTEPEQPDEIPRKELTCYTLGLTGQNQLYGMAGGNWFFHFCTNVLKLSPLTVGKMTGATTVFDALNDPVAGAIIDNYRFKDGRKLLPWIKYTSPFIAVLAFMLFINWNVPSTGLMVLYCTVVYVMWDILYSFQDAALWGMTAAISNNSAQRARATQWADIGTLLGGLLPGLLLPMLGGGGAFGLNQQQVYLLFATFMCLGGGFLTMASLGTKERARALSAEIWSAEKNAGESKAPKEQSFFKSISVLRHNYVLLLFLASELLKKCSPRVTDVYIFQQLTYQIGGKIVSAAVLVPILVVITGLPGTAMKFFATKIADRVGGMKRVLLIGCVTEIVIRLLQFAIGIKTLPAFIFMYSLQTLHELPNGIYNIAMRSMISDSVEYVEWKTGKRTEGVTMSVRNLMSKMSGAIESYIQGLCLHFLQFNAANVELGLPQNAHFQKWIWPMYRLGPVLGLVFALIPILLLRYPDSLKRQVESEMAERRKAGVRDQEAGIRVEN